MWIQIHVYPSDRSVLYLPPSLALYCGPETTVRFGAVAVRARVEAAQDLACSEEDTYERPGSLRITERLQNRLLLPASQIYRVKFSRREVLLGPVIGLLLGSQTHRYSPRHMRKYSDRFGIYPKVGGLVCAFSPSSVDWKESTVFGLYYNIRTKEWEYGKFPLPDAVYRRDFHSSEESIDRLMHSTDGKLFNSYRFTKYELYNYIEKNSELAAFLPATRLTESFGKVRDFIARYPKVILKPVDLSRGRGICVFERMGSVCRVTDYRYKVPVTSILPDAGSLENFFSNNPGFFSKYLMQQYIQLAHIGNSLFDVRVVMQKHPDRIWRCGGIECRVSGENCHLTNISRGGSALTLDEALERSFGSAGDLPRRIDDFCRKFCLYMDEFGAHFAEFGMDIAVDTDKNLWLIEANVFPSFKGFKATDRKTYLSIRYTPLLYALSLTPFGEDEP